MLTPLAVRLWHAVHAIGIVLLLLTGIQLRFPDLVGWFGSFSTAVTAHNVCGFVVLFDYFLWLGFYVLTGQLVRQYVPTLADVTTGVPTQANYYFARIFLGDPPPFEPTPHAKFNALQKTTYCGLMLMLVPLQIITGILLWDLETFRPVIQILGGVRVVDAFHILIGYIMAAFLIAHIYLSTLGNTFFAHFKEMVLGYEEKH
jgi:thiosulfate reductase cytochrome b subunit